MLNFKLPAKRLIFLAVTVFLFGCATVSSDLIQQYQDKSKQFQKQIQANPNDNALKLSAADFYYKFRDWQQVIKVLFGQTEQAGLALLAKAYTQNGQAAQALEIFGQLGESADSEYMFLYGQALEEKNLFPKATEIYKQVNGSYREKAQARLKKIGLKIERGLPEYIRKILNEDAAFLATLSEDEVVYLAVDEQRVVNENNTMVDSAHIIMQVLKERGKSAGEVEIGYDSSSQRIELEYARTITPEGKIIYAGQDNIRDVSKYLNFPLYSNARAFIISMPAVDLGAIIEYKVKIYNSKMVNGSDLSTVYSLRERHPIVKSKFKLSLPANRKLNFMILNQLYAENFELMPKETTQKNQKIYTWELKYILPIVPEEKMPPVSFVNPAVAISSFSSWQDIYQWWNKLFVDKISLSNEIKKFTKELIKDCADPRSQAQRIYEFCSQNIRYVGVEYGDSGYEPHYANDVFLNRYGDCKDKATLLVAMLRFVGLKAYPVLIPTRSAYSAGLDFPSLNFNHAIAALDLDQTLIFMDPTSATTSFSDLPPEDQDRAVLIFLPDSYKVVKTPRLSANQTRHKTEIKILNNEDAIITRQVSAGGFFAAWQRYFFKYTHPEQIRDVIKSKMVAISSFSKALNYRLENADNFNLDPQLWYEFKAQKLLNPAGNLRMFPFMGDIDLDPGLIAKDSRKFPIDFGGIYKNISQVTVILPDNLKLNYLPSTIEKDNAWFNFKANYKKTEQTIEILRELSIKQPLVAVSDYAEFKKSLEETLYSLREEIILEKKL